MSRSVPRQGTVGLSRALRPHSDQGIESRSIYAESAITRISYTRLTAQ
jgi:hypothetical protein